MIKIISKYLRFDNITYILFIGLFFRLFLANFGTLQLDHGTFVAWGNSLAVGGLKNFYNGWSDYFPGYLYLLWILGKINLYTPEFQEILFKLPAIFADILTSLLIYKVVVVFKKNKKEDSGSEKVGIVFALMYLFNPAIFANSTLWGQADSLTSLFSIFSIYMFTKNIYISAISLAIGTLIKPQAAFILPAFLYMFINYKKNVWDFLKFSLTGLFVFVLGFVPFNNKSNLFEFILDRISISSNQYPYGSVNAFSFWGIFGFWKPDTTTFWIGLILSILTLLSFVLILLKRKTIGGEYLLATLSFLITFIFMTRMHERHLLPALAPLLVYSSINIFNIVPYAILSLTYVSNLGYAYVWITKDFKEIFNLTLVRGFILLNITSLALVIVSIFKKVNLNFKFKRSVDKNVSNNFLTKDATIRYTKIALSIIVIFGFITRVCAISKPTEMYFDEIYHSFTAKLVLHNDPKAWEWWNPHPEGFAYEWTHPPLSKLGMALGMTIFGESAFGWRIPQAILGTLSIIVIYFLAYQIFKDRLVALFSAAVFSLDGLPLVLSRMGMNDSYVLFFSLLSILMFITASNNDDKSLKDVIKNRNVLSALFFGFAIASKWSAIYTLPILLISHFVFKKKIKISYLSFAVLPIVVYISSYSLMFSTGHTWSQFVEVQKQMWWYHTNLVAEHPYTSPAWSWPLLLRPIYLYDGGIIDGFVARIYAFGNPFVFWFGLFSIIFSFITSATEKFKKLGFVVFSYLVLFLPWIASPRIMFLYHYLPSIPFLAIATGFMLRRFPKVQVYYFAITLLAFIYFFPHWTGIRIPVWLDESYYWLNSWR